MKVVFRCLDCEGPYFHTSRDGDDPEEDIVYCADCHFKTKRKDFRVWNYRATNEREHKMLRSINHVLNNSHLPVNQEPRLEPKQ